MIHLLSAAEVSGGNGSSHVQIGSLRLTDAGYRHARLLRSVRVACVPFLANTCPRQS